MPRVQPNAREVWQNYVSCNGGFATSHREYRRAYLINVMLLAAMGVFFLFTLLNLTYFHLYHLVVIDGLAFVASLSLAVWFRKSRRVKLGSLLVSLLIALALLSYVAAEKHHDYSFVWLATFPPFAYFLNGLKRGTLIILIVYLPSYGLLLTGLGDWQAADYTPGAFSNILVATTALTALVYFYEKSRSQAVRQLRQIQEKEAIEKERSRLMREMHDGLGSQLTTALYMARNNQTSVADLSVCLEQVLDDLRLMMDSLQTFDGDVATLLGQLRYRMERRLQAAGLELVWKVDDLPDDPEMTPQEALNLQRIVQEGLANVIKHAQASQVEVSARMLDADYLRIAIEDNGCGFDPEASCTGRGLDNLFHRAAELGSELTINSRPGGAGCQLELTLNLRNSRK
ncbi:ATP-binding protein [Marinospirillum sp.]|uniref:sensor histidine kinase n=1 Tax=Marinospirillum sp. TaxID=2183934 RepID=UPI0028708485|nr:ATP-binding protein [Marinospirillum sp.]MDR9468505.1 ATP-binding protein [Marinospirillum sp.]